MPQIDFDLLDLGLPAQPIEADKRWEEMRRGLFAGLKASLADRQRPKAYPLSVTAGNQQSVIPAGIAGIQTTGIWSGTALHGDWVPAIPAGTTGLMEPIGGTRLDVGLAQGHRQLEAWRSAIDQSGEGDALPEPRETMLDRLAFMHRLLASAELALREDLDGLDIAAVSRALPAAPYLDGYAPWVLECARLLLGREPSPSAWTRVPVALGRLGQSPGLIATLRLRVLQKGSGAVGRDPADCLGLALDPDFIVAVGYGWKATLSAKSGADGLWGMETGSGVLSEVEGSSVAGAAAVGWYHALRGTRPDPEVIVLAGTAGGSAAGFAPVGLIGSKVAAIVADGRFDTVVVAGAENRREAEAELVRLGAVGRIRVVDASGA